MLDWPSRQSPALQTVTVWAPWTTGMGRVNLRFRDRRRYSGERKKDSPEAAAAAAKKREGKLENIMEDGVTVVVVVVEHRALRIGRRGVMRMKAQYGRD
jgi:hypothetical protein